MKRWQVIVLAAVVVLGIAVVAGYRMGVRLLQGKIVEALGRGSRVNEIKINWFSMEKLAPRSSGYSAAASNNERSIRLLGARCFSSDPTRRTEDPSDGLFPK